MHCTLTFLNGSLMGESLEGVLDPMTKVLTLEKPIDISLASNAKFMMLSEQGIPFRWKTADSGSGSPSSPTDVGLEARCLDGSLSGCRETETPIILVTCTPPANDSPANGPTA